jgi:hypothetical protein
LIVQQQNTDFDQILLNCCFIQKTINAYPHLRVSGKLRVFFLIFLLFERNSESLSMQIISSQGFDVLVNDHENSSGIFSFISNQFSELK